jgi:hypothetical protein
MRFRSFLKESGWILPVVVAISCFLPFERSSAFETAQVGPFWGQPYPYGYAYHERHAARAEVYIWADGVYLQAPAVEVLRFAPECAIRVPILNCLRK